MEQVVAPDWIIWCRRRLRARGDRTAGGRRGGRGRSAFAVAVTVTMLLVAGCGDDGPDAAAAPDPPVGSPVLPDLMPKPQNNVLTQRVGERWRIRFNTIIVNIGDGDFLLRAIRNVRGGWTSEQNIPYSREGAKRVRTRARLAWGGDGHDHWHIERVARVRLVQLDEHGRVRQGARALVDTKVGFCFYDHSHELPKGLAEPRYSARSCGEEDTTTVGMGLSPGWNDTYRMGLPGQAIDVTDLPDGRYRLFTDIDPQGWFVEASTANNHTWIDLQLRRTANGLAAPTVATGPSPS